MRNCDWRLRFALPCVPIMAAAIVHIQAYAETTPPIVQGAPIDAPVEPKRSDAQPDSLQGARPLGRALPQDSLDMLKDAEGSADAAAGEFQRTKDGKHIKVTFGAIGEFAYEVPDPDEVISGPDPTKPPKDQIPACIKALNKKQAVLVGFMVPIEVEGDGEAVQVKSFALTQNQMFCCFGVPPAMNQWVMVTMEGAPSKYYADLPVAVYGEFEVGEDIEDGYIMSIYRMRAEKTMDVRDLLKQAQSGSE